MSRLVGLGKKGSSRLDAMTEAAPPATFLCGLTLPGGSWGENVHLGLTEPNTYINGLL